MSESAITARWRKLKAEKRCGLVVYLTAGYPDRDTSLAALRAVEACGADLVEVGVPFSDPLADGPAIQRAAQIALEGGMSVGGALELVARAELKIPVVMFSYLNPILAYGIERFLADARGAGASGLLVTDLPAGEDPGLEDRILNSDLDLIRLIAPTTTAQRMRAALEKAEGFVYLIARLGVTGPETEVTGELKGLIGRVKSVTHLPVAVGFGIRSGEQAAALAGLADGLVVGSALIERLERGVEAVGALVSELRRAMDAAGKTGFDS
ncbi:MAG: tryptophan synthase alpha chain [Gemmatimonadales bacterium]|nr:MAG: tryptophan synthase alpha chain [Gemmatimonadales bacterium]